MAEASLLFTIMRQKILSDFLADAEKKVTPKYDDFKAHFGDWVFNMRLDVPELVGDSYEVEIARDKLQNDIMNRFVMCQILQGSQMAELTADDMVTFVDLACERARIVPDGMSMSEKCTLLKMLAKPK